MYQAPTFAPPTPQYNIPGTNDYTTNPSVLNLSKQGVAVPGVGVVTNPEKYSSLAPVIPGQMSPQSTSPQPGSPALANNQQVGQTAAPIQQNQSMENVESPAVTPTGQKYQSTLQNLNQNGGAAPTSAGAARMAISQSTPPPAAQDYKPTPQFMQYGDPIMKTFIETALGQSQEIAQKGNLVKNIQATFGNQLSNLNTQEMNLKNMIEGTDDDIRAEIGKAGGFATESQVQALANSRNKDLLRQYNNLEIQKQGLQAQMTSQVQLANLDREYAKDRYDNTMQAYQMYSKIEDNTTDSVNKLLGSVGYAGMAAAYNNDPYALGLAEQKLGLAPGVLSNPSRAQQLDSFGVKAKDPLDTRLKQLQIARAERELASTDPNSSTGGDYGNVVDSVANLLPATRQPSIKKNLDQALKSGDYESAYAQIGNVVEEMLPGEQQNKFATQRTDVVALQGLKQAIDTYASNGGDMGLLKGTEENIKRNLGIDSGKATELATMLWREFQTYRLNMTGAAFTPEESRDYASVNPTLGKSLELNQNVIKGALSQLENRINSTIKTRVPGATSIGDIAKNGFALKGLTATFSDGSSLTFPSQGALEQFKKDRGL